MCGLTFFKPGEAATASHEPRDNTNFTIITRLQYKAWRLCASIAGKTFSFTDGAIIKHTAPTPDKMLITQARIDDLEGLKALLDALSPAQCASSSIFTSPGTRAAFSNKMFARLSDDWHEFSSIRDKKHMTWPSGLAVMAIDIDDQGGMAAVYPEEFAQPLTEAEVVNKLSEAIPELMSHSFILKPSASGFIRAKHDHSIAKTGGWRLYFLVNQGTDIRRASKVLVDRLWLAGFGCGIITRAGAFYKRSLIDDAIYNVARLDYCGPSITGRGLERYGRAIEGAVIHHGPAGQVVDTKRVLPALAGDAKAAVKELVKTVEAALKDDRERISYEWALDRVKTRYGSSFATLDGRTVKAAVKAEIETMRRGVLREYHEVFVRDNRQLFQAREHQFQGEWSKVTVATILQSPELFHEVETLDPLEPEYRDFAQVGMLFTATPDKLPMLVSHAHGRKQYLLAENLQDARFLAASIVS